MNKYLKAHIRNKNISMIKAPFYHGLIIYLNFGYYKYFDNDYVPYYDKISYLNNDILILFNYDKIFLIAKITKNFHMYFMNEHCFK